MLRLLAWCLFALSLLVAMAAFAAFTPAIAVVVPLLPLAAWAAWRGARLPALLTGLGGITAVLLSPLPLLAGSKPSAFLLLVLAGLVLLTIALLRPRMRRHTT